MHVTVIVTAPCCLSVGHEMQEEAYDPELEELRRQVRQARQELDAAEQGFTDEQRHAIYNPQPRRVLTVDVPTSLGELMLPLAETPDHLVDELFQIIESPDRDGQTVRLLELRGARGFHRSLLPKLAAFLMAASRVVANNRRVNMGRYRDPALRQLVHNKSAEWLASAAAFVNRAGDDLRLFSGARLQCRTCGHSPAQ